MRDDAKADDTGDVTTTSNSKVGEIMKLFVCSGDWFGRLHQWSHLSINTKSNMFYNFITIVS